MASQQQIADAMIAAGFPQEAVQQGLATVYLESGGNENAMSPTGCCGVWQMCPCVGQGDVKANTEAAFQKWKGAGNSFANDWWRYDGGPSSPRWQEALAWAGGTTGSGTPGAPSGGGILGMGDLQNALGGIGAKAAAIERSTQNKMMASGAIILGLLVAAVGAWFVMGGTKAGAEVQHTMKRDVVKTAETAAVMVPK